MSQSYNDLSTALNKEFQEPLADLIARSNPLLNAITKKAVASDRIYIKAKFSSSHSAAPITDGSEVTFSGEKSVYKGGVLDWSTYISKVEVPKRLIQQLSSQPGALGQILKSEIEDAARDLADRLSQDLWKGDTANGITGIKSIIDDDNTYAGFDRSVSANAPWRGLVLDAANTGNPSEISTSILYQAETLFYNRNYYGWRERPSMFTGMVTPALLDKYASMFTNIDLSSLSTAHFVNQANQSGYFGNSVIGFLGVPFLRDHQVDVTGDLANSGRLYFMDMSKINLCVLTTGDPSAAMIHQTSGYQTAPNVDGIKPMIEILGNKGEMVQMYLKVYVQLACNDPAKAGVVIKNLKTT